MHNLAKHPDRLRATRTRVCVRVAHVALEGEVRGSQTAFARILGAFAASRCVTEGKGGKGTSVIVMQNKKAKLVCWLAWAPPNPHTDFLTC